MRRALVLLLIGANAYAGNQVGNMSISPVDVVNSSEDKVGNLKTTNYWRAIAINEDSIFIQFMTWNGSSWEVQTTVKSFVEVGETLLAKIRKKDASIFSWNTF